MQVLFMVPGINKSITQDEKYMYKTYLLAGQTVEIRAFEFPKSRDLPQFSGTPAVELDVEFRIQANGAPAIFHVPYYYCSADAQLTCDAEDYDALLSILGLAGTATAEMDQVWADLRALAQERAAALDTTPVETAA